MLERVFGAVIRACIVCGVMIWPLTQLPRQCDDTQLITMVIALCAGLLTFWEYACRTPNVIAFRFAQPYNAIRFIGFATIVILVSQVFTGGEPVGTMSRLTDFIGQTLIAMTGGYYGPAALLPLLQAETDNDPILQAATAALGAAWTMVGLFLILPCLQEWPGKAYHFNIWLNLPLFYAQNDIAIIPKLERGAAINLIFALTLPVVGPWVWHVLDDFFLFPSSGTTLTKIWVVTVWAFLPANFAMRAIALWRVAQLVKYRSSLTNKRVYGDVLA